MFFVKGVYGETSSGGNNLASKNRGYEIVKRSASKDKPKTVIARMLIENISSDGESEVQKIVLVGRSEEGKNSGKAIVKFIEPADMRGTQVFQVVNNGKTEQYVYIPAVGKWRSIPSKSQSFFGSELTYEDLLGRNIDDNEYEFLGEKDGMYIVKAIPKNKEEVSYDYYILYIDKESYNVERIETFKGGKIFKVGRVIERKDVQGYSTPLVTIVENLFTGRKTKLSVKKVLYNKKIPHRVFEVKIR